MRVPQIRLAVVLIVAGLLIAVIVNVLSRPDQKVTGLATGATGLRVTAVQWLLNSHQVDVGVTGTFAGQTESAVREFQSQTGLKKTGQVDEQTFDKLAPTTRPGDRGLQVRAVQTLLHLQGNQVGVFNDFDPATQRAVKEFQRSAGLNPSGVVDQTTWRALFDGTNNGPSVSEADQFFATLAPFAQEGRKKFGVPAAVAMAQAAQETGWGRAAPGNNYYGVKCHNQKPGPVPWECHELVTGEWENGQRIEIRDRFRTYASMRDSVLDYGSFLRSNSRYAPAFAVNDNADAFARGLQTAGYATDPAYADSLIAIMQERDLYQYDR